MRDTELYRHLLGLESPWTVARVELNVADQRVDVWAEHGDGVQWPCPERDRVLAVHDHAEERVWRHLDSYMTLVCNLDAGTVEHVTDDRKTSSLDTNFATLSPGQLNGIEAVAVDMWEWLQ
jgi:hypothetical protein